jgi:2-polyprenyl-3-methyl-5-hydroxy-6-metoxy-1,4-benzoquinol methylase
MPVLDPVAAYDQIAPVFAKLAHGHKAFLESVERLVISALPVGSRSLLDVGTGNGSRARRIARSRGISELVLLEPAVAMQDGRTDIRTMRAEDLHLIEARFDVILCLWNVLGHVFPTAARSETLRQFARLLAPHGRAFVDVAHRYNARHYGVAPTAARFIHDLFAWREENGDVAVNWDLDGKRTTTTGHVFTHREMVSMCRSAGLDIEKKFVLDYATGQQRRWSFEGHLLYVLTPAIASRRLRQTSAT